MPPALVHRRYWLTANDGYAAAIGDPTTQHLPGPTPRSRLAKSTSAVTSLTCCPAGAGAQLTFALSTEGAVTTEVLNIAGRPIKLLVSDRPMPAGTDTLI